MRGEAVRRAARPAPGHPGQRLVPPAQQDERADRVADREDRRRRVVPAVAQVADRARDDGDRLLLPPDVLQHVGGVRDRPPQLVVAAARQGDVAGLPQGAQSLVGLTAQRRDDAPGVESARARGAGPARRRDRERLLRADPGLVEAPEDHQRGRVAGEHASAGGGVVDQGDRVERAQVRGVRALAVAGLPAQPRQALPAAGLERGRHRRPQRLLEQGDAGVHVADQAQRLRQLQPDLGGRQRRHRRGRLQPVAVPERAPQEGDGLGEGPHAHRGPGGEDAGVERGGLVAGPAPVVGDLREELRLPVPVPVPVPVRASRSSSRATWPCRRRPSHGGIARYTTSRSRPCRSA